MGTPISLMGPHLIEACAQNDHALVQEMIRRRYPMNYADADGQTPLHAAISSGNPDLLLDLLDAGADVDGKVIKTGWTALHIAVSEGRGEMVNLLVLRGANPHEPDLNGLTPLSMAAAANNAELEAQLLSMTGSSSGESQTRAEGEFGLPIPSGSKRLEAAVEAQLLLNEMMELRSQAPRRKRLHWIHDGGVKLFDAIHAQDHAWVKELLRGKVNVNYEAADGATALHIASQQGRCAKLVDLLLEARANVDAKLRDTGWTPLHFAVYWGSEDIITQLVLRGSKISQELLELADCQGRQGVADILRQYCDVPEELPAMEKPGSRQKKLEKVGSGLKLGSTASRPEAPGDTIEEPEQESPCRVDRLANGA